MTHPASKLSLARGGAREYTEPMAQFLETVRTLAAKARRKELPNRAELVQLALELLEDHMEHTEHFVTEGGKEIDCKRPQRQAANKALEVASALALKDPQQLVENKPDELRQQLDAMGYMLVKKPEADGKANGAQH